MNTTLEEIWKKLSYQDSQVLFENKNIYEILKKKYDKTYNVNLIDIRKVLADLIYHDVYTNRQSLTSQVKFNYKFNDIKYSKYLKEYFWRSPNWFQNAKNDKPFDKIFLSKGYDSRFISAGKFVVDDYEINANTNSLVPISTIYHPAFETNGTYNFIRGKEFLEVGSVGLNRFYFNVNFDHPEFEPLLHETIRQFQTRFDIRFLPFYLKFFANNDNKQYERADNFIVYTEKKHFNLVIQLILEIYKSISEISKATNTNNISFFRDHVPLFVKELSAGLGFAEEHDFGLDQDEKAIELFELELSFGEKICEILALAFAFKDSFDDVKKEISKKIQLENKEFLFYLNKNTKSTYYNFPEIANINLDAFLKINVLDEGSWFDYNVFNNKKYLFAAIRIKYLILKEMMWSEAKTPFLFGYRKEKNNQPSYFKLSENSSSEGMPGVKYFLDQLESHFLDNVASQTVQSISSPTDLQIIFQKPKFKNSNLNFCIEYCCSKLFPDHFKITLKDFDKFNAIEVADSIIHTFFTKEIPFENGYDGSKEFSPSLNFGLAGIGLFFLLVYDKNLPNYQYYSNPLQMEE